MGRDLIRKGDFDARCPRRRRWRRAADPLFVLALGRLARSRELDRPSDRLWTVHKHDMEPSGSGGFVRPLGIEPRPALCRRGADKLGSYDGAPRAPRSSASIADEAAGPLAQLLAVPLDGGGDDGDDDPLKMLRADIRAARGRAMLVETTSGGWGEGKSAAPQADWRQQRLGPAPPEVMAQLRRDAFAHVLAACGAPPSMFVDNADGTAQREAVRRWHLNTVLPLARMVEHELSAKLETPVRLKFDSYALDMVSRATVVAKLTGAGVAPGVALAAVGLVDDE